jgi:hypothetical protein
MLFKDAFVSNKFKDDMKLSFPYKSKFASPFEQSLDKK